MLIPSTVAIPAPGKTDFTTPRLPFSLPRRINTVSPLTIVVFAAMTFLQHLRRKRGDLQKAAIAQFAHHRPEDARAARIEIVFFTPDDDARVVITAHDRTVGTADRRGGAHDHRFDDLAFFDGRAGDRALHRADDNVAHVRIGMPAAA